MKNPVKLMTCALLGVLLLAGCAQAPDGAATVKDKVSTPGYFTQNVTYVDKTPITVPQWHSPTWSIKLSSGTKEFDWGVDSETYEKISTGDTVCFRDNKIVSLASC